jgi:hypothetical protein
MGRTACTELQCLYEGAFYFIYKNNMFKTEFEYLVKNEILGESSFLRILRNL